MICIHRGNNGRRRDRCRCDDRDCCRYGRLVFVFAVVVVVVPWDCTCGGDGGGGDIIVVASSKSTGIVRRDVSSPFLSCPVREMDVCLQVSTEYYCNKFTGQRWVDSNAEEVLTQLTFPTR
jgi:hypothetical protein